MIDDTNLKTFFNNTKLDSDLVWGIQIILI